MSPEAPPLIAGPERRGSLMNWATMPGRVTRTLREIFLRAGYFISAAILLPYTFWVYTQEWGSFSRVPVSAGILLLCVVTFYLYFSTTLRFRFRFSWRRTLLAVLLFALLGLGFAGVLSVILFSYFCEGVSYRRERRRVTRPRVSPNLGVALVIVLALVVFPLLNEMYYRGTQAKLWSPDYNKQNFFYGINEDGFRGPRVPLARNHRPRLLFLGDSSPFGWPYRYDESFPFVVQDILQARGIDVEVVNAATIGQSIGQIRHQLPYFLAYQPDLVFLMTGVHYLRADRDFQQILQQGVSRETRWRPMLVIPPMLVELVIFSIVSSPIVAKDKGTSGDRMAGHERELESFKTHLRAVVQQIKDSGAHLYLVDYPTPLAERRVQDEIRRVGEESGTDYIPLFELIGTEIKNQLHDRVHPNRQGHRLIAEEIATVAAKALTAEGDLQKARARTSR